MATGPKARIDPAVLATSGGLFGLFLSFMAFLSTGHTFNRPSLALETSIVSVALVATAWRFAGPRALASILGMALATIACVVVATAALKDFFHPDPRVAIAARAKVFLGGCQPAEIRVVYYVPSDFNLALRTIDSGTGKWIVEGTDRHQVHFSYTSESPYARPYSADELDKAKSCCAALVPPKRDWLQWFRQDSDERDFCVAFFQDGILHNYRFDPHDAGAECGQLIATLSLPDGPRPGAR